MGIFGNPGLDASRALVNSADMVLLIGVDRQAVDLISDASFSQFEPDAGSAAYHRWYEVDALVLGSLTQNARRLEAAVLNLRAGPEAQEYIATGIGFSAADGATHTCYSPWIKRRQLPSTTTMVNAILLAFAPHPSMDSKPGRFQIDSDSEALSLYLKPNDVISVDVGDVTLWASLCLCLTGGQRRPNSNVIAIAGDGGAQMTIAELATATQHNANVTLLVLNNKLLGRVLGDEIESPDFVALARAYGGDGAHVTSAADVEGALSKAFERSGGKGGYVMRVEVKVDPKLKAEYAKIRDETAYCTRLRESLDDLLPSDLRPSDVRKLIAFDTDGNGVLTEDDLAMARKVLRSLKSKEKPAEFLALLRTGQLFKNPVLTSAKHLYPTLSPSPFHFAQTPGKVGDTAGSDIDNVLDSLLPEALATRSFAAAPYKAGFEVAAFDSMRGLGEMVLKDGRVFVRETDDTRSDFFRTRSGEHFYSTGAVLVPNDAVPDLTVRFNAKAMPQGVSFVRL
ncbi:hypothetical protein T492DRAFT_885459, partial [Pavlovales sp. CCMP2436]